MRTVPIYSTGKGREGFDRTSGPSPLAGSGLPTNRIRFRTRPILPTANRLRSNYGREHPEAT